MLIFPTTGVAQIFIMGKSLSPQLKAVKARHLHGMKSLHMARSIGSIPSLSGTKTMKANRADELPPPAIQAIGPIPRGNMSGSP